MGIAFSILIMILAAFLFVYACLVVASESDDKTTEAYQRELQEKKQ